MKKLIVVSVVMAVALLAWSSFALAQPQDPAKEEKPTFYRLTPGVYVNGWPRFTVTYPKDWVEKTPLTQEAFRAGAVGPLGENCVINVYPPPYPLDHLAEGLVSFFKNIAKDVTVVSDKPSQLRDGTPAREVELQMVMMGLPLNNLLLATNKGDTLINIGVGSFRGRIREDLKAIPYSLQFEPGKDEPVKVPPDVQEFFDRHCNDLVSHDLAKIMANYSDKYLNSGVRKGEVERGIRLWIDSMMSVKGTITDFVPAGDRAYLTGFTINNFGKSTINETSIIKENGEWKWYGNQRGVSP